MKEIEEDREKASRGAEEMKDPMSGYASADELDPGAHAHPERSDEIHAERLKDAMSGYASADAIAAQSDAQREGGPVHVEETQDSLSGYASADELGKG